MRLVDADSLMPLFVEKAQTMKDRHGVKLGEDWLLNYYDIKDTIDKAPTIEPCYQTTSCLDCKMYDKKKHRCPRFCEVIRDLVNEVEEPTGEWKRHDEWRNGEYIGGFYHVNCPCEDGYYSKWETNFCPNCGADMRKEKEE